MNERRRMLMEKADGYTEIMYLKSTGTQYIDTGYKPNQNTKIVCTMKADEYSEYGRLFGCNGGTSWNSTPNYQMNYETGSEGNFQVLIGDNTSWSSYSSYKGDYNKHDYVIDKGNAYRDGTLIHTNNAGNFQCTTNLAIFSMMYSNGITSSSGEFFRGRVYSFQIYDDDVLVRNFVPVEVEGVGYLYDKVTKQLFGNQGSGAFVCGLDKAEYNKVLMTSTTNPEVMAICYAKGWCADADYMTYGEAANVSDIGTVFNNNTSITHFDELKYFSLSSIDNNAFYGCSSLENITLPETVTSIGEYAFYSCTSLQEIGGYENVLSIGRYCFANCNSLVHFTIPNAVSDIKASCFQGSGAEITLHNNIVNLRNTCFSGCRFSDTELVFPNLASCLFGAVDSTNATEISIIGSQLTYLAQHAFSNNLYLEKVELNMSLTQIQADVFENCPVLSEIVCANMSAPSLDTSGLTSLPNNGVIKVPIGATGYDQGGWAYLVNNKGWTVVYGNIYPKNLVPVEYLQSAAWQCKLDTGVVPSISKKFIVDGLVATDENVTCVLFDSAHSWSTGEHVSVQVHGIWNWADISFSDVNHRHGDINTKSRHIYEIDANGSYIDGSIWSWTPSKTFEGYTYTINLFCDTAVRIYNFKVKDNGVLTMNLVPVRNGQTGCMYDTVSGQVFYNNYSGNFILGPDI